MAEQKSSKSTRNLPSKGNIAQNDDLSFWTVEAIRLCIEIWFLSRYDQRPSSVDDLSKVDWSDSDIGN
ncbi:MAG TPA: hypothetical protein DCS60_02505 [Opitutae bacterium]|nr:hypothetical protein [Opitutae bacterium]